MNATFYNDSKILMSVLILRDPFIDVLINNFHSDNEGFFYILTFVIHCFAFVIPIFAIDNCCYS